MALRDLLTVIRLMLAMNVILSTLTLAVALAVLIVTLL
jgi:hypothetical protein